MEHKEFVQAWKEGGLIIDVDRSKALRVVNSGMLPKRYHLAHTIWSWVWMLSIPTAIGIMFFYKWWVGLAILAIGTPVLSRSTKSSAMQFMIDHALEDPAFFDFAVSDNLIVIRQKV